MPVFSPLGTSEARLSSEQPYRPIPKQNLTPSTCREGRCSRLQPRHVSGCRVWGLCTGAQQPGRAPGGGSRRSRDPQAWLGSHRGGGSQADKRLRAHLHAHPQPAFASVPGPPGGHVYVCGGPSLPLREKWRGAGHWGHAPGGGEVRGRSGPGAPCASVDVGSPGPGHSAEIEQDRQLQS